MRVLYAVGCIHWFSEKCRTNPRFISFRPTIVTHTHTHTHTTCMHVHTFQFCMHSMTHSQVCTRVFTHTHIRFCFTGQCIINNIVLNTSVRSCLGVTYIAPFDEVSKWFNLARTGVSSSPTVSLGFSSKTGKYLWSNFHGYESPPSYC